MDINTIIADIDTDIRQKTAPKSITTADTADPMTDIATELLARGVLEVADTAALGTLNGSVSSFVFVHDVGIFKYVATTTRTVDGLSVFNAVDSGFWIIATKNQTERIEFETDLTVDVAMTATRIGRFGISPSFQVWTYNESGGADKVDLAISVDNTGTTFTFYLPGVPGFILIK